MKDRFTTFEIEKALNIKHGCLRAWVNEGFIKPTWPAKGQGTKSFFTRLDVYKIAVFKILILYFKRSFAAKIIENAWIEGDSVWCQAEMLGAPDAMFDFGGTKEWVDITLKDMA